MWAGGRPPECRSLGAALLPSLSPVHPHVSFGSSLPSSTLLALLCTSLPLPNVWRGVSAFPTVRGISGQGDPGYNLMCTTYSVPWLDFNFLFLPLYEEDCKSNCLTELFENDFTHSLIYTHIVSFEHHSQYMLTRRRLVLFFLAVLGLLWPCVGSV